MQDKCHNLNANRRSQNLRCGPVVLTAGLFVHAVFPPSSSTSSLSTDTLKYRATFISCLMLGP
uniref:Uncharacterized protein n=1 Tax=Myoviridae sp. ctsIb3 TaxID=2825189 RepID=A0A8S5URL2_9CAUD|nr:MAG TPA: hypothetical protein [Myoviridae sp. ctsIb3]